MPTIVPVILAGGDGKRLRPLSSSKRPKQFLKLIKNDNNTLLQASAKRALMVADASNVITVTSASCSSLMHEQLKSIDPDLTQNIILEPASRNTTAAITLAAIHAASRFNDPILWIIPSDHTVIHQDALKSAIKRSVLAATHNKIVTFGINPTRADSNYGYIVGGDPLKYHNYMHSVRLFVEKPKGQHLNWIMNQDNCWWNSGMFVLSAHSLFSEVKRTNSSILEKISKAYKQRKRFKNNLIVDPKLYASVPSAPIDQVVMETSHNLVVYPIDIGWSDIGSWQSVWELSQRDGKGKPLENFLSKIRYAA